MLEDVYLLSPLQEGLYYHWLSDRNSPAYIVQMSYRAKGTADIDLLRKSYQSLVSRHAVLRTFFAQDFGSTLLQIVKKEAVAAFHYQDASGEKESFAQEYKEADRSRGFDLNTGSQMRLTLLGLADNTYEFIWTFHHIIMDGWCVGILVKEFFIIYQSLLLGNKPALSRIYPYSSYIKWLGEVDKQASLQYWEEYLSGYDTAGVLPKTSGAHPDYDACEKIITMDPSLRKSLRNLCIESGITEYIFFQAAWGILTGKYNDTSDVVFGSVVSGRPAELEGVEGMVGLFINTIPVRIHSKFDTTVRELLKEVRQASIEGNRHHYVQLAEILSKTELGRNLFDHILVFENYPVQETMGQFAEKGNREDGLSILAFSNFDHSNYDFTLTVVPGENIIIKFNYNGNVYQDGLIDRLQVHFIEVIRRMLSNPAGLIAEIDCLNEEEKHRLLITFNNKTPDGNKGYAAEIKKDRRLVPQLFETQAGKTPDEIALLYGTTVLTYKELNEKANRMAHYLKNNFAVRADDLIGIMLDRSEMMLVAILGILKSGAAYVPIDPLYARARKEHIIRDTDLKTLITQADYLFDLNYYSGAVFAIDIQLDSIDDPSEFIGTVIHPDDLAYVIYTSGSTGLPKGCAVTHGNLSNYIHWANGYYFNEGINPHFGLYTSLCFDLTITSVFCPLTTGGRLTIYPQGQEISEILKHSFSTDSGIDCIKLTPSHINLLDHLTMEPAVMSLAIVGGEQITSRQVRTLKGLCPSIKVYNEYGPTEATVGCIVKQLEADAPICIGKPISNATVYILNKEKMLCPVEVAGEIYIGGDGLARGYLNNPGLTLNKFIPGPFQDGARLYSTGDQGRWLPDGDMEFIGRKDDQVKIRGYRIELGEIESTLQAYQDISAAVVIARSGKDGDKELIAYMVSKDVLDVSEIRAHLNSSLPPYMLPSHFIRLEELPLTRNGKIDRNRLPDPEGAGTLISEKYQPPRNEIEDKILRVWQDLLGRETIGINDNFFDVGGTSIKIMLLSKLLSEAFDREISIALLFQYPKIKDLGDYMQEATLHEEDTFDKSMLLDDLGKFNY